MYVSPCSKANSYKTTLVPFAWFPHSSTCVANKTKRAVLRIFARPLPGAGRRVWLRLYPPQRLVVRQSQVYSSPDVIDSYRFAQVALFGPEGFLSFFRQVYPGQYNVEDDGYGGGILEIYGKSSFRMPDRVRECLEHGMHVCLGSAFKVRM